MQVSTLSGKTTLCVHQNASLFCSYTYNVTADNTSQVQCCLKIRVVSFPHSPESSLNLLTFLNSPSCSLAAVDFTSYFLEKTGKFSHSSSHGSAFFLPTLHSDSRLTFSPSPVPTGLHKESYFTSDSSFVCPIPPDWFLPLGFKHLWSFYLRKNSS